MKKALSLAFVAALSIGLGACGGDDNGSSTDSSVPSDNGSDTAEFDQGSDEALLAIEEVVANGLAEEYGEADVECPAEITEAEGEYECEATFAEDDSTAVVTVSTTGGNITLVSVEPAE